MSFERHFERDKCHLKQCNVNVSSAKWSKIPCRVTYDCAAIKGNVYVPGQVRTLNQVGTKKISKGGWTILELVEPCRNRYFSFRSQSD